MNSLPSIQFSGDEANEKLRELRRMYEPYVRALASYLHFTLPPWVSDAERSDDWQTSAWDRVRGIQRAEGPLGIDKKHL